MPEPALVPVASATPVKRSKAGAAITIPSAPPTRRLGYLSPMEFLMTNAASAPETLAVSALPLNTQNQPEDSGSAQALIAGERVTGNKGTWRRKLSYVCKG